MLARVDAPFPEHGLRAIIDQLSGIQPCRSRPGVIAQMPVEIASQNRAAAVGVADKEWIAHPHFHYP
jgi:hypothetical protein